MPDEVHEERDLVREAEGSPEFETELLIAQATDEIARVLHEQGLTRADLAERLGTTRALVTHVLSGSRNMTLRTVASFACALGQRCAVRLEPLHGYGQAHVPMTVYSGIPKAMNTMVWSGDAVLRYGTSYVPWESSGPQLTADFSYWPSIGYPLDSRGQTNWWDSLIGQGQGVPAPAKALSTPYKTPYGGIAA